MEKNLRKPEAGGAPAQKKNNDLEEYEMAENRRQQMFQLGHIIKTLDEYKQIKKVVDFHDKLVRDLDQWRH